MVISALRIGDLDLELVAGFGAQPAGAGSTAFDFSVNRSSSGDNFVASIGGFSSAVVFDSASDIGLLPRMSLFLGDLTGDGAGLGSSSVSAVSESDVSKKLDSSLSLTINPSSESELSSSSHPISCCSCSSCRSITGCVGAT